MADFEQKTGQKGGVELGHFGHVIHDNFKLVYDEVTIQGVVKRLASEIESWSDHSTPLMVLPLMNGALFFASDLLRCLKTPIEIVTVSSKNYVDDGVRQSDCALTLNVDVKDRAVLVVDDICDSGETLTKTVAALKAAGVGEVRSAVLIKRVLDGETFEPDYVGIKHSGKEWFVGYGMDSHSLYRNLPELYAIER